MVVGTVVICEVKVTPSTVWYRVPCKGSRVIRTDIAPAVAKMLVSTAVRCNVTFVDASIPNDE